MKTAGDKNFTSEAMAKLSQAERRTPDYYLKKDPDAAKKQMEESKDFLIQMVLANAKNVDPFSEEGNKSNEMAQTMTTIAQIDAMMAQSDKMDEIVNAVKNPGFSATELQGKEIEYDDSKRYFDPEAGQVDFSYNMDHAEEFNGRGTVKTNVEIVNSEGVVVFRGKGADQKGEHHFVWNGKDKDGNPAKRGYYNIRVKSEGSYFKDGVKLTFPVRSSATLSGKVVSVETENGIAKGVWLEGGKFIEKNQISLIKDTKVPEIAMKLDPAFMDNEVNFDLSKMQIKKGEGEVYFNNSVEKPGALEIKIHDASGKFVKTIDYKLEKGIKQGINSIILKDQIKGLPDGNYTVSVKAEDLDHNSRKITLDNNYTERVAGLNYKDNKVIIRGEKEISSHNINKIISQNYKSLVDQANSTIGKTVTYRDDTITFQKGASVDLSIGFSKSSDSDEDALLYEGVLYVYDADNNMVQIVKGQYNPFEQLTDEAKVYVINENPGNVFDVFNPDNFDILASEAKLNIYRYIENEIAKDPINMNIVFNDNFKKAHMEKIGLTTLSWDGKFGDMRPNKEVLEAKDEETFRMEFVPTYIRPDGTEFHGKIDFNKSSSVVEEVKVEGTVITLILTNGKEITDNFLKIE